MLTPTPDPTGKPEARVIKFRAWDEQKKVMHHNFQFVRSGEGGSDWVLFVSDLQPIGSNWAENPYFAQQLKVMQFTGLFDRNGKEIYEGDIVKIPDDWDTFGFMAGEKRQIILKDGGFRFAPKERHKGRGHWLEDVAGLEVIGNIMQNPELLA